MMDHERQINHFEVPKARLSILVLLIALSAVSCAHYSPRWTVDNVAPPASMEEAYARIEPRPDEMADEAPVEEDEGAPPEDAAPIDITLDAAIRMALDRNRSIEVQSYNPEIVREAIAEARAAFDSDLLINASYQEKNSPGSSQTSQTSASAASSASQADESTTDTELIQALTALKTLAQQVQQLSAFFEENKVEVVRSDSYGADMRITQPLPTGTELYVSSGITRSGSSEQDDPEYTGTWTVGVTQELLRGFGSDVNLVALRKARNNAVISDYAFCDVALSMVAQVESAYWELALAQETLRIRQFSLALAEEQLKLNDALIAVGKLARTARISAEAEVAAQKASLVDAEADLRGRSIDLWQLLNPESIPPESLQFLNIDLPVTPEGDFQATQSKELAKLFRPDLAQTRLDVRNGELTVVQTKNGLLPQLTAFASYGVDSSGTESSAWRDSFDDTTFDQFEAGLTFSMTLGNRAEKARYRQARLQLDQAEAVVRNLEQSIEAEVLKAIVELTRQKEQMAASKQEVLSREEELAVETEQFRLGRSTNLDVLQIQQNLTEAKVQEVTARVRYLEAITGLYQTEGTLLTRRGIVLATDEEDVT